jgi:DNA-binding NtrC family response regulator
LDNVQELNLAAQRVLLSFLPDEHSLDSGEDAFRLISSTSINLETEVEAGRFRRELFFRLNGACLRLPPLRNRVEDITAFLDHFLFKHARLLKKPVPAPAALEAAVPSLFGCPWPGNIRELENLARKMVAFGNVQLAMRDLTSSRAIESPANASAQVTSLKAASRAASVKAERELILQALERTHWNRKRAARELQISYKSLLYKIKNIGVTDEKQVSA